MDIRTIFKPRGYNFKDYNGTFGLEIETEVEDEDEYPSGFFKHIGEEKNLKKFEIKSKYFYAIEDHSLRNFGREFVLSVPLPYEVCIAALDDFNYLTRNVKFIDCPPGASVHVHVNMLPEKLITLANFITLWVLFETPLIEFCGTKRRSNLFALPVRVAEGGLHFYERLFQYINDKSDLPFSNFNDDASKYSALNIVTLGRLGTVEIRTMRGTTDTTVLKNWITLLHNMLKFARTPGLTPFYILQESKDDLGDLCNKVFGVFQAPLIQNPSWKTQVERNLHYVYSLVDSIPSWDNFGDYKQIKLKPGRRKKKEITQDILGKAYADYVSGNMSFDDYILIEKEYYKQQSTTAINSLDSPPFVQPQVQPQDQPTINWNNLGSTLSIAQVAEAVSDTVYDINYPEDMETEF